MLEILTDLTGKQVDVACGASISFRGTIRSIEKGVLRLEDEEHKVFYIAIDKIVAVCETAEHAARPGFIG